MVPGFPNGFDSGAELNPPKAGGDEPIGLF